MLNISKLDEIKGTAFANWLREQPINVAAGHLYNCLYLGEPSDRDNMGWRLMDAVHGDKYAVNSDTIYKAIDALR